jgi:hypothetical protein
MDGRARRIGENEVLYRHVNERIRMLDDELAAAATAPDVQSYLCECGRADCTERIRLATGDYERVRDDPATFAIVPGHEEPDVEDVVELHEGWAMIRKHDGDPGEFAAEHDPRG